MLVHSCFQLQVLLTWNPSGCFVRVRTLVYNSPRKLKHHDLLEAVDFRFHRPPLIATAFHAHDFSIARIQRIPPRRQFHEGQRGTPVSPAGFTLILRLRKKKKKKKKKKKSDRLHLVRTFTSHLLFQREGPSNSIVEQSLDRQFRLFCLAEFCAHGR